MDGEASGPSFVLGIIRGIAFEETQGRTQYRVYYM